MQPDQVPLFREVKRKLGLPLKSDFKLPQLKQLTIPHTHILIKTKANTHTYIFTESLSHPHRIVLGQSAK